jgi:rhodanese-related sulfurtransferase
VDEATSAGAALTLRKYGVTNVKALLGGWGAWVTGGNRIVTGPKPAGS